MNGNINSYMPVKIISGNDCVVKNASVFGSFGKKCVIVTGGSGAQKSGALRDCAVALWKCGINYNVCGWIEPNPTTESCRRAGKEAYDYNADFVIGIGGGSALDAAKAVAIFARYPDMAANEIYARPMPADRLPLILIDTTAGTGSEVTGVSVLTDPCTGRKKSISGSDCYADVAFCDHKYTMSLPFDVTVSTALDAFCHAVEAYLASPFNDLTDMYALKAMEMLYGFVTAPKSYELTDELRKTLYFGSVYAGLAINIAGTDFPHTVGYYLTENYGIPHGNACAVFMPVLLDRAEKYCPEKLKQLCLLTGYDVKTLGEKIKASANVIADIGIEEAEIAASRWSCGVKNFDRTPGGFTVEDAATALCTVGI